ncbi:N-(5'-phosphoribosyl)anthranilate isomerase [Geodia barretti]|uniref:phosphoribosylanthranilate isomerase n=1 Tax=Geodia barretti TaxID=519541 RepID=A0AA35WRG0_GEOBA|nr:N-(5'-phosphoribosyl)anthranilate isomerase [Geodia barretti]
MSKEPHCSVKICGITSIHDARLAADAGADYVGVLVDVAISERTRTAAQAAEIASESPIPTVILLYNRSTSDIQEIVSQVQPFAVQLLGQESPQQAGSPKNVDIPAVREEMQAYRDAGADFLLFDSVDMSLEKPRYGGTGKTCDWNVAAELIAGSPLPVFFAGGIRPENVKAAIETIRPHGIDLCSGVEASKGVKDPLKLERLMEQIDQAN